MTLRRDRLTSYTDRQFRAKHTVFLHHLNKKLDVTWVQQQVSPLNVFIKMRIEMLSGNMVLHMNMTDTLLSSFTPLNRTHNRIMHWTYFQNK